MLLAYYSRGGSAVQSVEVVHGRFRGEPGVGEEEEDVEMVALRAGRHQQHATGGREEGGGGRGGQG